MKGRFALFLLLCLPLSSRAAEQRVSFAKDLAPVFVAKCLACHNAEKAKGGYRAHNFEALLQPGKSKTEVVVPGRPEESELFLRLTTQDEDDRMPQNDDPLSSAQIELFRLWIAQGAVLDEGDRQSPLAALVPAQFHPAPPSIYPRPLPVIALAFSPDGGNLAVSGYYEVNLFSLEGKLQRRLTNVSQRVQAVAFQPEGKFLAVAGGQPGRSGELSLLNLETGERTNLVQFSDVMIAAAFSADGKLLAGGGADHSIHLFATADWSKIATIRQHADWVMSLAFDPDGSQVLSASRDRTARIYDTRTGELALTYPGHSAAVYAAACLPGGLMASAGRDRSIHLWDGKEGKKRNEIRGAGPDVYSLAAAGEFLFAASRNEVRQYTVKDRKQVRAFSGSGGVIYCIALDSTQTKLAAGFYDGTVRIWNIADGAALGNFVAAPMDDPSTARAAARAGD